MKSTFNILNTYGAKGVEVLKEAIAPLRATGKTADSVYFKVEGSEEKDTLRIIGRGFFETLETGRGPRKSSQQGDFKSNMLEYMQARGIGVELSQKKREQLARFLTWKINKEGDKTFKKGGRKIYSDQLDKFVQQLREAVLKDWKGLVVAVYKKGLNAKV